MTNTFIYPVLLTAALFVATESTLIKISPGTRTTRSASSMNLKSACQDLETVNSVDYDKKLSDLVQKRPEVTFHKSSTVKNVLTKALNKELPGTKTTAGRFLAELRRNGCPTYIFGGAVRDALLGVDSKDIDAETDCELKDVAEICINAFRKELCHHSGPKGKLLNFGSKDHIDKAVDMVNNEYTFYGSKNHLEYSPNALAFDYGEADVIIGLSQYSVKDACNMEMRIPADDWEAWAKIRKDGGKKIFRYWKLRTKGFSPVDEKTTDFVIRKARDYIRLENGWIRMKEYYCNIMYGTRVVHIYTRKPYVREGCDLQRTQCYDFKQTGVLEKANRFTQLVDKDLQWKLPTCDIKEMQLYDENDWTLQQVEAAAGLPIL